MIVLSLDWCSLMEETVSSEEFWPRKIKQHWKAFIVFIIGCICAAAGAVLVLFWFIETSSIGAMGTATFGEWSLAWIWGFFIFLILWELLLVGIPVIIALGLGWYLFWRSLSDNEQIEFKERDKKKHRGASAGSSFSILMFIAFSIYMYINGYFYAPFDDYPYSFWVYSWFHSLGWLLLIFGIPVVIILILVYVAIWRKKE